MSLSTLTFDCPPAKWQGLRRALAKKDVHVPDELSGEIDHKGSIVTFKRVGNILTVDLIKLTGIKNKLAWKLSPDYVIAKVRELFEQV